MRVQLVAQRYARALFQVSAERQAVDHTMSELRALNQALASESEAMDLLTSPDKTSAERLGFMEAVLKGLAVSNDVKSFLLLLTERGRMSLFADIVSEFEAQTDLSHGVTRGIVESTVSLSSDERQNLEIAVKKVINKNVIFTYKTNTELIGGLVARVGGYTFDDSIQSHLRRLNEDLKRRTL